MLTQCWFNAGPPFATLAQHQTRGRSRICKRRGRSGFRGLTAKTFVANLGDFLKNLVWACVPCTPPLDPRLQTSTGSTPRVCWELHSTQYTQNICTMLDQRRRRCSDIVGGLQMFYVCWKKQLVWYCLHLTAGCYHNPTPTQCLFASAGQYPFCPSQYFILPVPACWRYSTGTMLSTKAGLMLARRL